MDHVEALRIVKSLAEGVDPFSSEPLAGLYQHPDIIRALFSAVQAMERVQNRDKRRQSLPPQAGKPWDAGEDARLIAGFDSGSSLGTLARIHSRTETAIRRRLEKLGKLVPEPRLVAR
jgi:hypothetical protein